jgi:hypothetical protein
MIHFGSGVLYGVPNGGNFAANPSPIQFGTLQSVSLDIDATLKELKGMFQFPDDIAVSDRSIKGKASVGQISGALFNNLFFADVQTTGTEQPAGGGTGEVGIIPSASTYVVTVANSLTFLRDYGVRYQSNGIQFQRVITSPTIGQYTVSAGVYTFAAADSGKGVLISYNYTSVNGVTTQLNNQLRGYSPSFELYLAKNYRFASGGVRLFSCKAGKLSMPTKMDDYSISEIDFEAFANPAGQVANFFTDY